jgi:hypothetical protein
VALRARYDCSTRSEHPGSKHIDILRSSLGLSGLVRVAEATSAASVWNTDGKFR